MKSRIFSSKYIRTISKGQLWIPAFLMLGFLLAFPVTGLVKLSSWRNLEYTTEQTALLYNHLWKDGFVLTGMVVVIVAAFINAVNGFLYLYSRKKTDFYHSLPLKRAELFQQRVITGSLYYLVPYVLMEFLTVCIGAAGGFFNLKLMGLAVKMLCLHLIVYLMLYFSIVLILCVTGNMLMGILCLGGMYLYGIALYLLLSVYGITFLDTFMDQKTGILGFLIKDASPVALAFSMISAYAEGYAGKLILSVVIVGIVFASLSWIAYKKRPSEAAGKSMVYRWVAVLVKFMIVVPTGLGIGWIFYSMTTGRSRMLWWAFGLLLGTIVSHGMAEVIYRMSFQKFFSKKIQLAAAGVLVIAVSVICQKDLLHFDSYIPKQENLAAVNISTGFDLDYYSHIEKSADGEFYDSTDNYNWNHEGNTLTGTDGIGKQTYAALQNIVKDSPNVNPNKKNSHFISVKYTLKSGRIVYRSYWADNRNIKSLMKGFYEEEDLKQKKYEFLNLDEKYLNTVSMADAAGMGYSIFQNDEKQKQELLDALKKDVEAATVEDMLEPAIVRLTFEYELPGKNDINNLVPGKKNSSAIYTNWDLGICPSFKNTLAILVKTGYPLTIEEIKIDRISLTYYGNEDSSTEKETVTYEKTEEIKALQKALTVVGGGYQNDESETFSDRIGVTVSTGQGEAVNMMTLKRADTPDFVLEKMKELGIDTDESDSIKEDEEMAEDQEIIGGADEASSIYLGSSTELN